MSMGKARTPRSGGSRPVSARWRIVRVVAAVVALALTIATPAGAEDNQLTVTLAPVGTGSYLVTVVNTPSAANMPGAGAITSFKVGFGNAGPALTNIDPSPTCGEGQATLGAQLITSILCRVTLAQGASAQVCYTGPPATEAFLDGVGRPETVTPAPAVAACPLPGFRPVPAASESVTKCVVPNVKGKQLLVAEKALAAAHCAAGAIRKARSPHVKKGRVISQGTAAGRSLPAGTKVSMTVSKGR